MAQGGGKGAEAVSSQQTRSGGPSDLPRAVVALSSLPWPSDAASGQLGGTERTCSSCPHPASLHWLRGGERTYHPATQRSTYTAYYRGPCAKCDCPSYT